MKLFRNTLEVFCAFCRSPRRVYRSKRIGLKHIFASGVTALLVMILIWREYDPRVLVIFVIFLAVAEAFVQLRWRMAVACKHCGFDPVVYRKDPDSAVLKVKAHLDRRKNDPKYLLAAPLNIPTRLVPPAEEKPSSRGRLLSKQI